MITNDDGYDGDVCPARKIKPQEKPDDGDGDNTKHLCSEEQVHRKEGLNFAKS